MNKPFFPAILALATASLLAIGCGSEATYTETETDIWDSDDTTLTDPGLDPTGYTETEPDPYTKKRASTPQTNP